jgi:hypothetical protein
MSCFQRFTASLVKNKAEISESIRASQLNKRNMLSGIFRAVKLSKSMQSEKSEWLASQDSRHFGKLPPSIQQIYQRAREKGAFVDEQFPHRPSSIGQPSKGKRQGGREQEVLGHIRLL